MATRAIRTALIVVVLSGAAAAADYTLVPTANGVQLKTPAGRVMFEYLTRKPPDVPELTSPSAACFHPVYTPGGERVSALAPDDHPHHRGIYLAWHDSEFRAPAAFDSRTYPNHPLRGWNIARADFWGWGEYAPREGRVIRTRDVKLVRAGPDGARIEIQNEWTVRNRKMLDEVNVATAGERDGVYVIDLEYRLTPLVDYFLDRQSFSGFVFQARKDGESYYADASGKLTSRRDPHYSDPSLNWPAADWYDFTIKLASSGKTVGAAVIDHPENPPSTWHISSRLWMLNPVIVSAAPMTIKGGETLTLRYRVVTHDGEVPAAVLRKLSREWRGR